MNYPANTKHWEPGDFVIHDFDAKKPRMLMRVIGYLPGGDCRTEYVAKEWRKQWGEGKTSRLINRNAVLHDPSLWGLKLVPLDDPMYDRDHHRVDGVMS